MKQNLFLRIAACSLLVVVISTAFLPFTGARYAASATGSASSRVAKWDVKFTQSPSVSPVVYLNGEYLGGSKTFTFTITNNSEVTADIKLRMYFDWGGSSNYDMNPVPAVTTDSHDAFDSAACAARSCGISVGSHILYCPTGQCSGISEFKIAPGTGVTRTDNGAITNFDVSNTNRTWRFAPGASANFTITCKELRGAGGSGGGFPNYASDLTRVDNTPATMRHYKLFADATQVD